MDGKTTEELIKISKMVNENMKKEGLIKEKPFADNYERLKEQRSQARTLEEKRQLDKAINSERLYESAQRETTKVNESYHKEVSERMEYEMKKAIKTGKIKPADKGELDSFMRKIWRK